MNLDVRHVGVVGTNYVVLAESSRAPVLAVHKYTVATQMQNIEETINFKIKATQFCLHKIYRESV